jgi:hypothetical protein
MKKINLFSEQSDLHESVGRQIDSNYSERQTTEKETTLRPFQVFFRHQPTLHLRRENKI